MPGIRDRRKELGIRQRDLASRTGLSERRLRMLERALAPMSRDESTSLAVALGCPVDALELEHTLAMRTSVPGEGYTTARAGEHEVTERRTAPSQDRLRVLDLFCGAGGLSYGFEWTDKYSTVLGVDLLPDRIATFAANHPSASGVAGDLTVIAESQLAELAGVVDVVVGGPPCQGFSSIRPFRNLTEGDRRNSLVEEFVLLIARIRPRWFLFENVVGLLTHGGGQKLEALVAGFRDAGYDVDWRVLNAALYGVPQFRERVVIVGNRVGGTFEWPRPTHRADFKSMAGKRPEVVRTTELLDSHLPPAVTLTEALSDLPPVESGCEATSYASPPQNEYQRLMRARAGEVLRLHKATRHSAKMLEIIRHAGANIHALPPGMVTSGFSSCYSRLDADRPSTTITVNFVHPASNRCIHPTQDRALTPREGARLQSFPDSFVFKGTDAQIVKQIGNAVPPLLARSLGRALWSADSRARQEEPTSPPLQIETTS